MNFMDKYTARARVVELAKEINARRFVEIGVFWGKQSRELIKQPWLEDWVGIDPYEAIPAHKWQKTHDVPGDQKELDRIRKKVNKMLHRECGNTNVRFIHARSQDVADQIEDGWADVVYIDGNHHYQPVCEDISLYLPKVRPGGLLMGDDYCIDSVKQAVDELLPHAEVEGNRIWRVVV